MGNEAGLTSRVSKKHARWAKHPRYTGFCSVNSACLAVKMGSIHRHFMCHSSLAGERCAFWNPSGEENDDEAAGKRDEDDDAKGKGKEPEPAQTHCP